MSEEKKPWNWGKPFAILSLVFGIIAVHFVFWFLGTSIFISTAGEGMPSDSNLSEQLNTLFAVFTYFALLILFRGVTEQELKGFPKGAKLVSLAKKLHLMKTGD